MDNVRVLAQEMNPLTRSNYQEMWQVRSETLNDGRVQRFELSDQEKRLSYAEVIDRWCDDAEFRSFFSTLLTDSPYSAFRWETPPVTKQTLEREFEFVLLRCDPLERPVDRNSFAEHFVADEEVVTFSNLGRDAILVVPCSVGEESCCGHLAAFVRLAPETQQHELWQSVGRAMKSRLNERPVWLSTAGMGVAWLHVRLDDRPKYYGYQTYKSLRE